MIKIVSLCVSVLLLLMSLSVFAASEDLSRDRGPVEVSSDQLEVNDQAQTLVFSGNAVATQDDITIHGDRLTVKYTGEERDIEQIIVEGSVRIIQGTRIATGEKAILYQAEERIVLTGSPRVSDGDDFVQGQEITIFLNDRRSVVTGGAGGRVKAVFTPKGEAKP
ncbi:MAG: lipopolysaccharide transport periplasmic protein LptA [Deltaproteobacteria bacterium]|nr:MAG: lipopolysaccharide transport periplasmic protein LptA [Deltaproteobacteria bacterium]